MPSKTPALATHRIKTSHVRGERLPSESLNDVIANPLDMDRKFSRMNIGLVKVLGEAFFLYGLLGWIYGVLIQLTHSSWLAGGLSHLMPWIRVDTFAILSFLVSILGFLMWRLAKELG
jgi:hypothetical protein